MKGLFFFFLLKGNNLLPYINRDNEKTEDKFSYSLLTIYTAIHGNTEVIEVIPCFSFLKISGYYSLLGN